VHIIDLIGLSYSPTTKETKKIEKKRREEKDRWSAPIYKIRLCSASDPALLRGPALAGVPRTCHAHDQPSHPV
jgi:hypothetical protein